MQTWKVRSFKESKSAAKTSSYSCRSLYARLGTCLYFMPYNNQRVYARSV